MKSASHIELGQLGEELAVKYLQKHEYDIVALNFKAPLKRYTAEIDIIAYDRSTPLHTLAFIEVKTRSDDSFAPPESAVDLQKQRRIIRVAHVYRNIFSIHDEPYRYDVIGIVMYHNERPKITLHKNSFSEDRLKKRHWV